MNHNKSYRKLGRRSDHRKAMFMNLTNSLVEHNRIETTITRAKELRKFAEGAKDGEIKATRPIVGILHRRMEKQTLLRTKIWIYETWTRLLTEGDMTDYLEHYN